MVQVRTGTRQSWLFPSNALASSSALSQSFTSSPWGNVTTAPGMPRMNPWTTGRKMGRPSKTAAAPSARYVTSSSSWTVRPAVVFNSLQKEIECSGTLKRNLNLIRQFIVRKRLMECRLPRAVVQVLAGQASIDGRDLVIRVVRVDRFKGVLQ